MAIARFEQDPNGPPGMGTFHGDDGSMLYAHDPELAAQVSQPSQTMLDAAAPPPDARMAASDEQTIQAGLFGGAGGQRQATPPSASDVPAGASFAVPELREQPQAAQPPPSEQEQAEALQQGVTGYMNAPVYEAPRKGGVVPQSQQMTVERTGAPYDPDGPQAQDRRAAGIAVDQATYNMAEAQGARAAAEAAAYQAQLPELQAKAAEAQRIVQHRKSVYQRERRELDAMVAESDANAKSFDANKWYTDRGAVGIIGAGIAQAFGAYAAALRGGPNIIAQQIQGYVDAEVQNQRAQIEAGKAGVNNQLAKLQRHYGDLDQAEAALALALQKKLETQVASYAKSTMSEDVMLAADKWLAESAEKRLMLEQQFENASYGKTSVQTAAKVIAPSRGGWRDKTEREKQESGKTLGVAADVVGKTYENEIKRQKATGQDPDKKDKTNELVIEDSQGNQLLARSAPEATKIREMKALHTNARGSLDALSSLSKRGTSLSPDDQRSFDLNLEQVINSANTMAGQGVVRTEDLQRIKASLQNKIGSMPAQKAVAELSSILDRAYQSRVDAQRGSAVKVAETGAGQKISYTGKPSKTPTAKGQFKQVGN